MTKTNRPKEPNKVNTGTRRKLQRMARGLPDEPPHKRPELGRQWKLGDILALMRLGTQPDHVPRKVNRRKREATLAQAAALPVADPVRGQHPATLRALAPELAQFVNDFSVLKKAYSRFFARQAARQAELEARVRVAEAAVERFRHDHSKCLEFIKSCTTGTVAATPLEEVPRDLTGHLTRYQDTPAAQETAHGSPVNFNTPEGDWLVGVTLPQEAGHPVAEPFTSEELDAIHRLLVLKGCSLVQQPSCFTRLVRRCMAQMRRLLAACTSSIRELYPVKGAANVEARHES